MRKVPSHLARARARRARTSYTQSSSRTAAVRCRSCALKPSYSSRIASPGESTRSASAASAPTLKSTDEAARRSEARELEPWLGASPPTMSAQASARTPASTRIEAPPSLGLLTSARARASLLFAVAFELEGTRAT